VVFGASWTIGRFASVLTYWLHNVSESATELPVVGAQRQEAFTKVVHKRRFPMIFHNEKHVYWH
jgi:hypothetical protein